jgi:hypothetical protein
MMHSTHTAVPADDTAAYPPSVREAIHELIRELPGTPVIDVTEEEDPNNSGIRLFKVIGRVTGLPEVVVPVYVDLVAS